jgi:hypothetical protein
MKRSINRKKILIFSFLGLVLFLILGYFLILDKKEQEAAIDAVENLFPFGNIQIKGFGNNNNNPDRDTQDDQSTSTTDPIEEKILEPRLRKITDFPTGGFGAFMETTQKEVTETITDIEGNTQEVIKIIDIEDQKIRYTKIDDGSIFESLIKGTGIVSEMIVENFIPNTEYSFFNKNADIVAYQYWNTEERAIETYLANINKIKLEIDPCPYDFSPVVINQDEERIIGLHEFLNRNPQTQLADSGINSPGNEGSLVTEDTITSIKNFQSLYQIEIDGQIGTSTATKMKELCDLYQKEKAEEEFSQLDKKYNLVGRFLPQNIIQISMSSFENKMFYLQKDAVGVIGFLQNFVTNTSEAIFESPFSEWISTWQGEKSINLNTKASYAAPGYAYELNTETKRYFKRAGGQNGLLVLPSRDNTKLFTSQSTENGIINTIYNIQTGESVTLSIQTLIEKCVWSYDSIFLYCGVPSNFQLTQEYPDLWYQGLESFTDSLWMVNTETFEETFIADFREQNTEADLDIETIGISPKDQYLYFIDKKTEFLWSYRLIDF